MTKDGLAVLGRTASTPAAGAQAAHARSREGSSGAEGSSMVPIAPQVARDVSDVTSEQGAQTPFLLCLRRLQTQQSQLRGEPMNKQWVNDSSVAAAFHRSKGLVDREYYKATRQSAINARTVQEHQEGTTLLLRLLPQGFTWLKDADDAGA